MKYEELISYCASIEIAKEQVDCWIVEATRIAKSHLYDVNGQLLAVSQEKYIEIMHDMEQHTIEGRYINDGKRWSFLYAAQQEWQEYLGYNHTRN